MGIGLVAGCCLVLAGCGDDDGSDSDDPPQRPSAPAIGSTVELARSYPFGGRERRVRVRLTARTVSGRVRDPALALPEGRTPYRVSVRIDDRGADPFPYQWARFSLAGRRGVVVDGPVQAPLRDLQPGKPRSPRATVLTFAVPRGFRVRELRVRSIVKVWPFRGRWRAE